MKKQQCIQECAHPGHAKLNMTTSNSLCSFPRGANQGIENTIFFIQKAIGQGISLMIKSRSSQPATRLSLWSHLQDEHDDFKSKLIC